MTYQKTKLTTAITIAAVLLAIAVATTYACYSIPTCEETQSCEVTITPSPSVEVTPSPTEEVTPTPEVTATPSATPTNNPQRGGDSPQPNNPNDGLSDHGKSSDFAAKENPQVTLPPCSIPGNCINK